MGLFAIGGAAARHDVDRQDVQLRRGGAEHRLGRRQLNGDVVPVLAGLLHDGRQVLELHRILARLAGAEFVLRPPGGGVDEIAELDLARGGVGLVDDDDGVALGLAGAGRQFLQFASGKLHLLSHDGGFLLQTHDVAGLLRTPFHDILRQLDGGVGVHLALFRSGVGAHGGEALEFAEQGQVVLAGLQVACDLLTLQLQRAGVVLQFADLLARVLFDGRRTEAGRQHADLVAAFGVERAGNGHFRQRRHDQLLRAHSGGDVDFTSYQSAIGVDGHRRDPAGGDARPFGRLGLGLGGVVSAGGQHIPRPRR